MTIPRSGSSMVTSIFHKHGLWIGQCEAINRFGYFSFENTDIRNKLRNLVEPDLQSPTRIKRFVDRFTQDTVRRVLRRIVPPNTQWVYKTMIDSWRMFDGLYPGIKFVFVKRNIDAVLASARDKDDHPDIHAAAIVRAKYEFMDGLSESRGIPFVNTDELIEGNYTSLEEAFAYCGITFDSGIADFIIKPEKWKHA